MAVYAIGDVQGCYQQLMQLLDQIQFDSAKDELWFAGDLVNRGPDSLAVLRFVKSLGERQKTVLGNHDIHFLAVAAGARKQSTNDTLSELLNADDRDELINWLRQQPLLHYDASEDIALAHAGIAPFWSIQQAKVYSLEFQHALQQDNYQNLLKNIFGNHPSVWRDDLEGFDRLRCIVNYFTRMRFCYQDGRLELSFKGKLGDQPAELYPWFDPRICHHQKTNILFGHWAALEGHSGVSNVHALDTGCAWGGALTALRLSDWKYFKVACSFS